MIILLKHKTDQIAKIRLGLLNHNKKCLISNNRNTDYKRMVALIANNDLSRLDVLFKSCFKRGKSVRAVCETLGQAINGSYNYKQYSEKCKDIGWLVLMIGGPRLVYAMNKLNIIPSTDIIRRYSNDTKVKEIYFSYSKSLEEIIATRLSEIIPNDNETHLYRYVFFVLFSKIILC